MGPATRLRVQLMERFGACPLPARPTAAQVLAIAEALSPGKTAKGPGTGRKTSSAPRVDRKTMEALTKKAQG